MKSVAINVGANSSTPGGRGPIYSDGSFRFVPITESDESVPEPTFSHLGLEDVRPASVHHIVAHFDPEFPEIAFGREYTYGDRHPPKTTRIAELEEGDVLFFYATLNYVDREEPEFEWINDEWGAYIIGQFVLERNPVSKEEYASLPPEMKRRFEGNAHVRRAKFDAEYLVLGDAVDSRLYDVPIPLSGERGVDPNYVVSSLSDDSDGGPWYRRPLRFGHEETEALLKAQESADPGVV